jgi:hypothetical protein
MGKEYVKKESFVSLPLLKLTPTLSVSANSYMGFLFFISHSQSSLFGSNNGIVYTLLITEIVG